MKILITGVYGIVGSKILESLKQDHHIFGIGKRNEYKECPNYIQCDLTEYDELEKLITNNPDIDCIVHCAALAHNKGNDFSFERFKKVNFESTLNLIELSNKYLKLKKFIFLSTISVYGEELKKESYKEEDKCNPKSPYAVTKKMSEDYIKENCKTDYYILRLAPVYSNDFLLNINRRVFIKGIKYTVGKGSNKLSLCNVHNITQIINEISRDNSNIPSNNIYNVSDSEPYTFKQISTLSNNSKFSINIPKFLINALHDFNKVTLKSTFINENSIKLLSDKIYPSNKIGQYISLKHKLKDLREKK